MSELPLLMALRVRARATATALGAATDIPLASVRARLVTAVAAGFAEQDGDVFVLSARGQAELATRLAAERIDRAALADAYEKFLASDARLKEAITAWQLAVPRASDATNASTTSAASANAAGAGTTSAAATAHSARALAELRVVAAEARRVAAALATLVPRHASYVRRLGVALDALDAGDVRFVASPRVDSLHQIWFELHQDLLVTLGRERAA